MSDPKETWYFFDYRKYERSLDWYESEFFEQCGEQGVIGEATPGYMAHPESPSRIAESFGEDLQFLFLLRDPDEQTADPSRNHVGLLEMGRYLQHLERYEEFFRQDQLHPFLFEDYTDDRGTVTPNLRPARSWFFIDCQ